MKCFKFLTLHWNVLDSEAQDDGPDHTKGHFHITIHNLCNSTKSNKMSTDQKILKIQKSKQVLFSFTLSADGDQLDSLTADKIQGLVYIGNFVETHFAFVWLGQPLAWYHKKNKK